MKNKTTGSSLLGHFLSDKKLLGFVFRFLLVFILLYYGTIAMIGLAAPGGYYSPFVAAYADYVSWLKNSLIAGVGFLLGLFGIETVTEPGFIIRIIHQRAVFIAMDCVGYGVYSFWIAYVLAHRTFVVKKIKWILAGLFLLWFINLLRISIYLVVINKNQSMPLGIDHHTWFNIVAYGFIFLLIYFFNKSESENIFTK